jgi:hypothetical protein
MGDPRDPGDPSALKQELSQSNSLNAPATRDGLLAFKIRRNYCGRSDQLGLRN